MTITKTEYGYAVITDTVLADGSLRADYDMELRDGALRSVSRPGHIRIGGNMRVKLGPKSLAIVSAMQVGQSHTF